MEQVDLPQPLAKYDLHRTNLTISTSGLLRRYHGQGKLAKMVRMMRRYAISIIPRSPSCQHGNGFCIANGIGIQKC